MFPVPHRSPGRVLMGRQRAGGLEDTYNAAVMVYVLAPSAAVDLGQVLLEAACALAPVTPAGLASCRGAASAAGSSEQHPVDSCAAASQHVAPRGPADAQCTSGKGGSNGRVAPLPPEQAFVSTPPITDHRMTPRKRKASELEAAVAGRPAAACPVSSASLIVSKAVKEEAGTGKELDDEALKEPVAAKYSGAAREVYRTAAASVGRRAVPTLLGPQSQPLAVTLQVTVVAQRRTATVDCC